jgi:hypothetical protein
MYLTRSWIGETFKSGPQMHVLAETSSSRQISAFVVETPSIQASAPNAKRNYLISSEGSVFHLITKSSNAPTMQKPRKTDLGARQSSAQRMLSTCLPESGWKM